MHGFGGRPLPELHHIGTLNCEFGEAHTDHGRAGFERPVPSAGKALFVFGDIERSAKRAHLQFSRQRPISQVGFGRGNGLNFVHRSSNPWTPIRDSSAKFGAQENVKIYRVDSRAGFAGLREVYGLAC